jgi:hypothetical protein
MLLLRVRQRALSTARNHSLVASTYVDDRPIVGYLPSMGQTPLSLSCVEHLSAPKSDEHESS